MKVPIQPLTTEAFAPFGQVIAQPERGSDATGPGWRWWAEIAYLPGDPRAYGLGFLDLQPAELQFDWAERHMRSVEILLPIGGDCLVYVGPPEHPEEPGRLPPLSRFQVFHVRQGQGVLLERGVWHGAPLALDRPLNAAVFLLQGTGREDTSLVRFHETPVRIEHSRRK